MLLKYVYIVFIGVLFALFVGVGIAAFYPSPKIPEPDFENTLTYPKYFPERKLEASEEAAIKEQEKKDRLMWKEYQLKNEQYNKNVSILAVSSAILTLIVSLLFVQKLMLISDGLLLGGVLTLIYSIIRSFMTNDFSYIFATVTVGLTVALILGYLKFIRGYRGPGLFR